MCNFIFGPGLAPGYGCCKCRVYNGLQREQCKSCTEAHCELSIPDDISRVRYVESPVVDCVARIIAVKPDAKGVNITFKAESGEGVGAGEEWSAYTVHPVHSLSNWCFTVMPIKK